jgi:hypothetical protein
MAVSSVREWLDAFRTVNWKEMKQELIGIDFIK